MGENCMDANVDGVRAVAGTGTVKFAPTIVGQRRAILNQKHGHFGTSFPANNT
jgi:hypothetical protein